MSNMKIKFESTLEHQAQGINAIVDIFQGQDKCESNFTVYSPAFIAKQQNLSFNDMGYGNRITLSEGKVLENVQNIQLGNGLKPSDKNEVDIKNLDFTIEMETGTGKTYVYLRTIMELYQKYGFSKHIIVVPSIPIKEGTMKSLEMTQEHLKQLYDNVNYNFFVYNSSKLNEVRDFSTNDGLEIMVINIDAFSKSFENPEDKKKKANIIHRYNDSLGYKPLDLIKNTNPVVYIDEPQSTMGTPIRKQAVKGLNPLAVVRYSATHKKDEKINMMYKLDAVDAYERKLVKQIEVGSIQAEGGVNEAYIRLLDIKSKSKTIQAHIEFDAFKSGTIKRIKKWVKQNEDLEELANREEYEGYIIKDIYAHKGSEYIDFTSKSGEIALGEAIGAVDEKLIKRAMISKTIEEHLKKELVLNPKGIKVLSLFFIDSVSKYRQYDDEGNAVKGEYAAIFEEEYLKLIQSSKYNSLFQDIKEKEDDPALVHNGYFSIDKKSKKSNNKDKFEYFKDTKGNTNADEDTYKLIMKDKENLLGFDSKLRFIFSHSALKEGWDNPNVFQITTLKEGGNNENKRRQEIGRGLRICVNQDGDRVQGHEVNILTVLASESYAEFVENLQTEIEQETGIKFGIIEEHSFSQIVLEIVDEEVIYLGIEKSKELYQHLEEKNYIDIRGKVQDLLRSDLKDKTVDLPEEICEEEHVLKQVINQLKTSAGKLEIRKQYDKEKVQVHKKVLDSPEFKALWDKVKFKTTYSVKFDSDKLINACIEALDGDGFQVKKGKLHFSKAAVSINKGGVDAVIIPNSERSEILEQEVDVLPDIVGYLQNETQLTRKSIVKILTGSKKLKLFKRNPQKFIEGCIHIINQQMKLHILDGIQYHKIGDDEYYSQELFENEELFGYLKSNLKESKKSPYDHVVYDSHTESELVTSFENSEQIQVYAKLPGWFKIDTPIGTYNPDWAILWKYKENEKLFFVVESKSTKEKLKRREGENYKIECGVKHFGAIDSEMIVAQNMGDIKDYALGE